MLAQKILSVFWILIFLFSAPAFAAQHAESNAQQGGVLSQQPAQQQPQLQQPPQTAQDQQQLPPTFQNIPQRVQITCRLGTLDPKQVQQLKDELFLNPRDANSKKPGAFEGAEIHAGTPKIPPEEREKLANNKILIPTGKAGEAIPKEIPNEKMNPNELSDVMRRGFNGPFAFGAVIDKTVRIGACKDKEGKNYPCYLIAPPKGKLYHTNEGEGIKKNFSRVGEETWKIFFDENTIKPYSQDEKEKIEVMAASQDSKDTTVDHLAREPKPGINVLQTLGDFDASMGTTCDKANCTITTYSAFDKYFNSWFSAELVLGNFGPTLVGQTKRLLGYTVRRGWPWDITENRFFNWWRRNLASPESLYGKARVKQIKERFRVAGLSEFRKSLIEPTKWDSGYKLIKSGSTRLWLDDLTKTGGELDKITDPHVKGELFKVIRDLRGYSKTMKTLGDQHRQAYQKVLDRVGHGSADEIIARIDYARALSKHMRQWDIDLDLDFPEYWMRQEYTGIYDKALLNTGTGKHVLIAEDSFHIQNTMREFEESGNWRAWVGRRDGRAYDVSPQGNLKLYKVDPKGKLIDTIQVEDLMKNITKYKDKAVEIPELGEVMPLNDTTIDYIANNATGRVRVFEAGWVPAEELTPLDFAQKITHQRAVGRAVDTPARNMDELHGLLVERNFAGLSRRYYSTLDKALAQEENILKSYFSFRGGLKWTALPFGYWWAKKGFVGEEGLSAYQLPDTWTALTVYQGTQDIYKNAYIDFFANSGSDTGDMFSQALNYLPWKMVLNKASDTYGPFETFDHLTGREMRGKVEDVAFFTHSQENCAGCSMATSIPPAEIAAAEGNIRAGFSPTAQNKLNAYLVEDTRTEEAKKKGQTLIAFTHATNIKGSTQQTEPIDLVKARKDKKTCADAVKNLPIPMGWVGKPHRVGAVLAAVESAGYFIFGWPGVIGTAIQQTMFTPILQDCVDDIEGYYIHFFDPTINPEKKDKAAQPQQKATEKVSEMIRNLTKEEKEKGQPKNIVEEAKAQIAKTAKQLTDQTDAKKIVQALVETKGDTFGNLSAAKIFFFWWKGDEVPIAYIKDGKVVLEDHKTGTRITQDNSTGTISVTGADGKEKKIIQRDQPKQDGEKYSPEDHARLTSTDGRVPARKIPQRLTGIGLTNTTEEIMKMALDSDVEVLNQEILNCIKQGIFEQTGVQMISNKLGEVFDKTDFISTTTHSNIHADKATNTIFAEGSERKALTDPAAEAVIRMNANVELAGPGERTRVGKLNAIRFRNGVIIYKPETHELLLWLQHNKKAILPGKYVSGLKALPTTVKNPATNCDEPAINLEAIPISGSDKASEGVVKNFNDSIKKMGPFQVFDTDTKRLMFYSELKDGQCINKVRVIDKKTGETLLDQPIVGPIEQTPTGIKFKTADGREHKVDFSAENGVPKISIDGSNPETLRRAQGPNGSFWYDPETGLWYPENSQLIPLLEAFKQQGFGKQVNPDGSATTRPSGSPLNITIGAGQQQPFNLPSLPENPLLLLLFVVSAIGAILVFRISSGKS